MLGWASWGTLRCAHDHGAATGEAFPGGRIEQAPAAFAPQHQPRALRRLGVCRICARPAHFSQFRSGVCPSRSISRRVPTGLIGLQFQSQPVASWPLTRVVECAGDDTRHTFHPRLIPILPDLRARKLPERFLPGRSGISFRSASRTAGLGVRRWRSAWVYEPVLTASSSKCGFIHPQYGDSPVGKFTFSVGGQR